MGKYIKCPRCELNYILEGEDYCHVCKSEMKHHTEQDEDELLDFDEMDICPVCGTNYIKESETMCSECKSKSKKGDSSENWEEEGEPSIVETDADSDDETDDGEEYNSGFSDIDPENDELDPYKIEDDVDIEEDDSLNFALEEEIEETFEERSEEDDFETVEVSDDDDEDDEDEEDYDFDEDDDMLGKRK